MKKFIIILVLAMSFFGVHRTYASVCGDPALNHPATLTEPEVDNVRCDGGNPEAVTSPWGTNSQVPHVVAGTTVYDEGGVSMLCPEITRLMGCSDISRSSYYRNQMIEVGRQLRVLGFSGGVFSYWINLSR